jgi:NAD(P)-dependent dehydrogenase (short-subunit alcohol dehydrogenase family)
MIREMVHKTINLFRYIKRNDVRYLNTSVLSPSGKFVGKNVLITGGSSGYGFAMAKQFVEEGASVIITGLNKKKLESAAERLNSDNLHILEWDVKDVAIIKDRLNTCNKIVEGGIDIFINNAGVTVFHNKFKNEDWDNIIDTNAKGLYFSSKEEAEYLKARGKGGKIINLTSNANIITSFHPYYISKWCALCETLALSEELKEENILVNSIAPGVAVTDINMGLKASYSRSHNAYYPDQRNLRLTMVEEVANLAIFIASDDGSCLIGQNIVIDGGMCLI